ncbi:hypothetical protein [Terricaulis sp.]|uniref:hypothetical protein n=1 Tax=Terricaulis sp. TaxID=2768686 RepID=UPI002AC4CD3D|nr:hypothetical protein [Terricaulis sp.]MDZ4690247.1 hypothetical protein [Terricaulis sp.]
MRVRALSLECSERLSHSGFRPIAQVLEDELRLDQAVALPAGRIAVIRYVESSTPGDHTALATMMTEGDFVWAGLVHDERDGSETSGLVETFHVSELDRLIARLQELREAFGEAG